MYSAVAALLIGAAACAGEDEAPDNAAARDSVSDGAAIRAQVAAYQDALNQRDGIAMANLYTTDGDFVAFDSPRMVGRDSIGVATNRELAAWPAGQRINIIVTNIRFVNPDLAIVETVATFTEGDVRENRGTAVLVHADGRWMTAALRVYPAQRVQ